METGIQVLSSLLGVCLLSFIHCSDLLSSALETERGKPGVYRQGACVTEYANGQEPDRILKQNSESHPTASAPETQS